MKTHYNEGIYTLTRKEEPQKEKIALKLTKSQAKALFSLFAHLGFDSMQLEQYPYNV